jgi:hypothetical protein
MKKKEFGILFWVHLLTLFPIYLSPLLFSWKFIVLGAILLQIQYLIIGGCYITFLEMGKDKNNFFMYYYLKKIFPDLPYKGTLIVIRYIVPMVIITFAIILQISLGFKPLVHFWL